LHAGDVDAEAKAIDLERDEGVGLDHSAPRAAVFFGVAAR
jgi:hypothetical protein